MADIDCGDCDCGDCDCDCNCDGCDCVCDCIEDCCSGNNNVILCCCFFLPGDDNNTRANRRASNPTDCSIFCCCCTSPRRRHTATSTTSSKKKRQKGFCSRIWPSCFRSSSEPSPPSSPPRVQPKTEFVPAAPEGQYNKQDGRYPLDESQLHYPPLNNSERTGKQARWEEQNMPHKDYKMDGKWSRPVQYGDHYNT